MSVLYSMPFIEKNPCDNGFAVCAGLDQIIQYIKELSFNYDDIEYLRNTDYLQNRF